jgi:hypothetical protein
VPPPWQDKLSNGQYPSFAAWRADVELTFDNAILYNPAGEGGSGLGQGGGKAGMIGDERGASRVLSEAACIDLAGSVPPRLQENRGAG